MGIGCGVMGWLEGMKFVMWVVLLGENEFGCGFVRLDVEYFGQFCFCIEANLFM